MVFDNQCYINSQQQESDQKSENQTQQQIVGTRVYSFRERYYHEMFENICNNQFINFYDFLPLNIFGILKQYQKPNFMTSLFYCYEIFRIDSFQSHVTCNLRKGTGKTQCQESKIDWDLFQRDSHTQKSKDLLETLKKLQVQLKQLQNTSIMKPSLSEKKLVKKIEQKIGNDPYMSLSLNLNQSKPKLKKIQFSNSLLQTLNHKIPETCANMMKFKLIPFELFGQATYNTFIHKYTSYLTQYNEALIGSKENLQKFQNSFFEYSLIDQILKRHKIDGQWVYQRLRAHITTYFTGPDLIYFRVRQIEKLNTSEESMLESTNGVNIQSLYENQIQETRSLEHILKITDNIHYQNVGKFCGYRMIEENSSSKNGSSSY